MKWAPAAVLVATSVAGSVCGGTSTLTFNKDVAPGEKEALAHFERAAELKLNPSYAPAQDNLKRLNQMGIP